MADTPAPIDYVDRWHRIIAARREQHDAACAAQGRTTDDYWARRAEGYRKFVRREATRPDPFLECVRRHLRPEDTVLDVGAGTGRHTLRLAPHAARVVALDPSAAMLSFLREDAAAAGLDNVEAVEGAWPEAAADLPPADIVICAHVLYPIEDVVSFLRALDAHARRFCFLHLMGHQPSFDMAGLWEAVHGEPRRPQPTYIDAVNVLHQLGCPANVEVAWLESAHTFGSLDEAMERFAESLAVVQAPDRLLRLRDALSARLQPLEDGSLALGGGRLPVATVWWEAGALTQ